MPWKCPICGAENRDEVVVCKVCNAYKPEATTKKLTRTPSGEVVIEIVESNVAMLVGRKFVYRINSPGVVITVGRAVENNIVIPDGTVSRRHLRLIATTNGVVVEDLGSSNGTYVITESGERRIKAESIGEKSLIRVGNTKISVVVKWE